VIKWKPFSDNAIPLKWIRRNKKPGKISGQVTLTGFINGWCPARNIVFERAKKASAEFGGKVVFDINTLNRDVFREWELAMLCILMIRRFGLALLLLSKIRIS